MPRQGGPTGVPSESLSKWVGVAFHEMVASGLIAAALTGLGGDELLAALLGADGAIVEVSVSSAEVKVDKSQLDVVAVFRAEDQTRVSD